MARQEHSSRWTCASVKGEMMVVEATESDCREMELVGDVGTKKDLQW